MIDKTDKFNYQAAQAELEVILKKVESPETGIDEIEALVKRAGELIDASREYLRSTEARLASLDPDKES